MDEEVVPNIQTHTMKSLTAKPDERKNPFEEVEPLIEDTPSIISFSKPSFAKPVPLTNTVEEEETDELVDEPITLKQPESFFIMEEETKTEEPVKTEVEIPESKKPEEIVNTFEEKVSYGDAKIQEIDITKVVPNPYQPRKIFEEKALQELADSIREHGVIQPIVVTETPSGYELVVGERRFRASQLAGVEKIPAIVKKQMQDQTKLEVALIENIQRQELNPIEEAQAYDRLMKAFSLTQEQVAKKVGKSRPAVANTIRLLNLPAEIQRGVIEGKISEGHARAILGLPDMERQIAMFNLVMEQGLNVRQVEQKVREVSLRRQLDAANMDPKFVALESELRQKLSAQVKIQRSGKGGKITIEFFSEDELNDILGRMSNVKENNGGQQYITV